MTIAEKINASVNNLKRKRTAIINAIRNKGVDVSDNAKFADLPAKIGKIEGTIKQGFVSFPFLNKESLTKDEIEQIKPYNPTVISLPFLTQMQYASDLYGFASFISLEEINMPHIGSVPNYCFAGCTNLAKVNLNSCTAATEGCFHNCSKLTKLSLPKCTWIRDYAFLGCSNLNALYVPKLVGGGNYLFSGVRNLHIYTERSLNQLSSGSLFGYSGSILTFYTTSDNKSTLEQNIKNKGLPTNKLKVVVMEEEEFKAQFINN